MVELFGFHYTLQPLWHDSFRERDAGIGNAGEAVHPAMGCFTVAFPANTVGSACMHLIGIIQHLTVSDQVFMAADAVLLNSAFTCAFDKDHLRFGPEREDRGVAQAIHGLKIIVTKNIVMGYMTIVACSPFTM